MGYEKKLEESSCLEKRRKSGEQDWSRQLYRRFKKAGDQWFSVSMEGRMRSNQLNL